MAHNYRYKCIYMHERHTYCCLELYIIIPYSAKCSRHLYFVDWPQKAFRCTMFAEWLFTGSHAFKSLHIIADNSNWKNNFRGLNFRVYRIGNPRNPRKLISSKISRYTVYIRITAVNLRGRGRSPKAKDGYFLHKLLIIYSLPSVH